LPSKSAQYGKGFVAGRFTIACVALLSLCSGARGAAVSCGGAAMLGAAQLNCSHVERGAPAQFCTFSWALHRTDGGEKIVEGSFLLQPGASNVQVYQAGGFDSALSGPIVMCRGSKRKH
jgi:hypothetical protein